MWYGVLEHGWSQAAGFSGPPLQFAVCCLGSWATSFWLSSLIWKKIGIKIVISKNNKGVLELM